MAENIENNGCSQRDNAEHEGYVKASRSFNRIWKEREVLSIPFVVVCLTLAIRGFVLYFVQLRIAKVKQTTTNGIDSTSLSFHIRLNDLDAFTYPSCSALSLCEQPLFSMFSAIDGHSSFLGHTQDSY